MDRRELLKYGIYGLAAGALPLHASRAEARDFDARRIVRCAIYPAIGIARVGNSPDGFFLGPEVPGRQPVPAGGFKDARGRILRQAARFRVFGFDRNGRVVAELNADNAQIRWQVSLANKKGQWYDFEQAFDIPESIYGIPSEGIPPLVVGRRNVDVTGLDRRDLAIFPGPRYIGGRRVDPDGSEPRFRFDGGSFLGVPVSLGDLRTDGQGRLLVLGGHGQSGTPPPPRPATTFANNLGWYDDTSDGPVEALVRIDGRIMHAEGAWVVVAPPNYAPGIPSSVTMYDVIFQASTVPQAEGGSNPPSFTRQIYPLLERTTQQQWVNVQLLRDYGWGADQDFTQPDLVRRLASPSEAERPLRTAVFEEFRNPDFVEQQPKRLPPYYGDAVALPPVSPRQYYALLSAQYEWLQRWADGDFRADWPASGLRFPRRLEQIPLQEQPGALDRASLDDALGGPFHPGCEMTWPMRIPQIYDAPFRLRRRKGPEPDWGHHLTSAIALAPDGPLSASGPGDLTRWMAVPWQTDSSSCRFAYDQTEGLYLPTFWPAHVPNHVLPQSNYETIMRRRTPLPERQAAFQERQLWFERIPVNQADNIRFINQFIQVWGTYGIVTERPGPGDPNFPDRIWVQEGRDIPPTGGDGG